MENIYSQTEHERYSTVELPDGFAKKCGEVLYSWLGSLWRNLHSGDKMVRGLHEARGIRLAQMYLDILEASELKDRNGAPVFHRELWHPIVVRRSKRDSAQENLLELGGTPKTIGPQPDGSIYGAGTVFKMGKMARYQDFVTYPVDGMISGGALSIVDNIVNPSVLMECGEGKDFVIRNGSIIFPKENDPLGDGSPFERYDVPGESDDPEDMDMEAVLWASDVLLDRNYIADHVSYALGVNAQSSDVVKRILNAAWSSVASGLTPELIKTLMAAMANVPVIQDGIETIVGISTEQDGTRLVETDKRVYKVSPKAVLRNVIVPGTVLTRGEFLDETIRIYPFLNGTRIGDASHDSSSISSDSSSEMSANYETVSGFSVPLEQDIPSIVVPSDIIRAKTKYGVYAMWGRSLVKRSEKSPGSDEFPHLYFDIGGTDGDVSSFWEDIWSSADARRVSMASILGNEGSFVSPAEFFLDNLVGANTIFAVVDKSQADDLSLMHDPMFFDMLTSVVPSAIRLFLVEHGAVGGEDIVKLYKDSEERERLYAALPRVTDVAMAGALPAMEGRGASFGERVSVRLVRAAPEKTGKNKEEDK